MDMKVLNVMNGVRKGVAGNECVGNILVQDLSLSLVVAAICLEIGLDTVREEQTTAYCSHVCHPIYNKQPPNLPKHLVA